VLIARGFNFRYDSDNGINSGLDRQAVEDLNEVDFFYKKDLETGNVKTFCQQYIKISDY